MEQTQLIIKSVNKELSLQLSDALPIDIFKTQLAAYINELIHTDFEKLVYYLYRIDVHEQKMKLLLEQNLRADAGELIAQLIIDRQLEKIKTKEQFRSSTETIDDDEKW